MVARVVKNPELPRAAAKLVMPDPLQGTSVGEWVMRLVLRLKTRNLTSVYDCQMLLAEYFENLVDETVVALTSSGLELLSTDAHYLFISNHRDIVMDSSLLNFLLHNVGHDTCRSAVGDNLLANELAADLMRLNKSFVVERSVVGARAVHKSLSRTSAYIRESLREGVSIWIAQREGRSKDGWDRTDPTVLKMLSLAHKDEKVAVQALVDRCAIVPVSVSYEVDPCALRKAHELFTTDRDGHYDKSAEEDLQSIVLGILGKKGRVHVHFGNPIKGDFPNAVELANRLDREIVHGIRVFPTHVHAAQALGDVAAESNNTPVDPKAMKLFEAQIEECPKPEQPFLLLQYANVLRNQAELGESTRDAEII